MSDDVKIETHFSKKKLLTPVTVADKLVLVNPFVLCLMRCLLAVSSLFVQRASLTVNIDISDVTNTYYTGKPRFPLERWALRLGFSFCPHSTPMVDSILLAHQIGIFVVFTHVRL